MFIKTGFNVLLGLCALLLTATTSCKLLIFISHTFSPSDIASHKQIYTEKGGFEEPGLEATMWATLVDIALLVMFVFQHSGMANQRVKEKIHKIGLKVAERSLYIICTTLTLTLLVHYWHRITWVVIWHANTQEHIFIGWFFTAMHTVAWILIVADTFLSDVFEFIGVKQVYNEFIGYQDPLNTKSAELCRLYSHMRHSSFICFCMLFWMQPMMSLDKLLLAIFWTIHMASEWRVDTQDETYTETRYHVIQTAFHLNRTKKYN